VFDRPIVNQTVMRKAEQKRLKQATHLPLAAAAPAEQTAWAIAALAGVVVVALVVGSITIGQRLAPRMVAAAGPEQEPFVGPYRLNSFLLSMIAHHDPSAQNTAYRLGVLATGLAVLAAVVVRARGPVPGSAPATRAIAAVCLGLGFLTFVWCSRRKAGRFVVPWPGDWYQDSIGWMILVPTGEVIVLSALVWAGSRLARRARRVGLVDRCAACLAITSVAAATFPSFVTMVDLTRIDPAALSFIEEHYSMVLGQADQLAAGRVIHAEVKPHYGLVLQFILAACQQHAGPISLGWTVRILSLLNGLYLGLAVWLLSRFARGRWLIVLPGLAMLLPWYHFFHTCLLYPNQAAWRSLFLPLALIYAWTAAGRSPAFAVFGAGLVSGLALLWNFETGIAVSVALAASSGAGLQILKRRPTTSDLAAMLCYPCGMAVALGMFLLVWRVALGSWMDPGGLLDQIRSTLSRAGSGLGGMRYDGTIAPLGLLGWSTFTLVRVALSRTSRWTPPDRVRVCAAILALVWLPYYFNRPDPWNMSSFSILLAVPTVDSLRALAGLRGPRQIATAVGLSSLLFLSIITSSCLFLAALQGRHQRIDIRLDSSLTARGPGADGSVVVSGVLMDEAAARDLTAKAVVLRSRADAGPVAYIARSSYMIPKLSGVASSLGFVDLMAESTFESQFREHVRSVARSPGELLVEINHGEKEDLLGRFFVFALRELTRGRTRLGSQGGWEVWSAVAPQPPSRDAPEINKPNTQPGRNRERALPAAIAP